MLRKILLALAILAFPLLTASAASAQQYPPTDNGSVLPSNVSRQAGDPGDPEGNAPLARTGLNVAPLVGVAVILMAGGAVAIIASRRRTSSLA